MARGGRRDKPPHLFACWPQVGRALTSAKRVALFLDFDGTLVPLRRRPSDVKPLGIVLRRVLSRLASLKRVSVYVISGRPLVKLQELVLVRRVRLLGVHGWEGRPTPPLNKERRLLRQAKQWLDRRLPNDSRIWVQDKGLALAVHYRGASSSRVRRARQMIGEVLKVLGPRIHMIGGHKMWELLPRQIEGKGGAVRALLSRLPPRTLPVFVGDDISDEKAFGVLPNGLTIHVGKGRRTKARFVLRNPQEVKTFLLRLAAEIK